MVGILRKVIAGFCYVEAGGVLYECKPRGNIKRAVGNILAGDNVEFCVMSNGTGAVEKVLERKNSLVRPPIANVDRLYIISAHSTPAPNALIIDRIIAIAESKGIEPIVVFNKSDMGNLSEWKEIYDKAGITSFIVSAKEPESLVDLKKDLFSGSGISVFTGNSGVGKSSILNAILPELNLSTGEVSEKLGRGRHTTRRVELFKLPEGGYIADTPGFSSMDFEHCETVLKDELPLCFREFEDYLSECRFTSCTHTGENGCAVKAAVDNGLIGESRYKSYVSLYNEVKDIKEWNLKGKK